VTRRTANLATILGLLLFLTATTLSAPRWARVFRREVAAPGGEVSTEANAPAEAAGDAGEARRSINVRLFFNSSEEPGLVMEEREVAFSSDLSVQLRTVVAELVKGPGPGSNLVATLPPETRVLEVFVTARGVAYVDLSNDATKGNTGGVSEELRAVYSVVNSVSANFPAIRRVQILVDDRPAETLAGHVDLSRPLTPDMTLLASSMLTPVKPSPAS
jgi:germination protein M